MWIGIPADPCGRSEVALLLAAVFPKHSLWGEQIDESQPCRYIILAEVVVVPSHSPSVACFQPDTAIAVPPAIFTYRYQDRIWADPKLLPAERAANAL